MTGAVLMLILPALAAGALTGLLSGLFGVGGGTVAVPVLYELFGLLGVPDDVRMSLSVGTSLAIIAPTGLRSFLTHRASGLVDEAVLRAWAGPVVVGTLLGTWAARYAPPGLFKGVFVVIALVSAARLLSGRELHLRDDVPGRGALGVTGGVIGILSSLMGIGGGQLGSLVLMSCGRTVHEAVATSSGLGPLIAIPGTLGYILAGWPSAAAHPEVGVLQPPLALGWVSLLGAASFLPTAFVVAPVGARLAHQLPRRGLEIAFGGFLVIAAVRFVTDLVG